MLDGWATTHHSAYDQRYYRQWMHELPPLEHIHRHTVLDVHHALVPRTARRGRLPSSLQAARPIAGMPSLHVLQPADMLLHGMTHLFHNEELSHGLRDLSDSDLLLREFGTESSDGLTLSIAPRNSVRTSALLWLALCASVLRNADSRQGTGRLQLRRTASARAPLHGCNVASRGVFNDAVDSHPIDACSRKSSLSAGSLDPHAAMDAGSPRDRQVYAARSEWVIAGMTSQRPEPRNLPTMPASSLTEKACG